MLGSLLLSVFSGITLFFTFNIYKANLGEDAVKYKPYREAVSIISKWLAETVDESQHHFQKCLQCGYELALVKDNQYCLKSDLFKIMHPEVMSDTMVFRDYGGTDLARQIIGAQFYDAIPYFFQVRPANFSYAQLPLETQIVYPYAKNYFRTHKFGKQAGCIFQKYFHVPGQEEISLKSNQSQHFHNYIAKLRKENKSEECIRDASYEKPTFKMWVEDDCLQFFKTINSLEYQDKYEKEGLQYIFKTNRHLGNGILLLDEHNTEQIREWYQNGRGCGENKTQHIIQEYVRNPYLFKGHKMEFRSYFAIASTNPVILYGYKRALIKQCALKYSTKDFTKEAHVCNTAVTKSLKEGGQALGDDDLYIDWNLEELQELLLSEGRIHSKTWLQDYLYPQIMRKITNLYFSVDQFMLKDARVGEFFGVDFILDDNLILWIFECNRNPNFLAVTEGRKEKFGKLIPDMLEIQMQLIRSRFKRVKRFLDEKIVNKQVSVTNSTLKKEFLELMRDRYEPEFRLPEENGAILAYADDYREQMGYTPYMKRECLENNRK